MATITIRPKNVVKTVGVKFKVIPGGKKDGDDKHGEEQKTPKKPVPSSDEARSGDDD